MHHRGSNVILTAAVGARCNGYLLQCHAICVVSGQKISLLHLDTFSAGGTRGSLVCWQPIAPEGALRTLPGDVVGCVEAGRGYCKGETSSSNNPATTLLLA